MQLAVAALRKPAGSAGRTGGSAGAKESKRRPGTSYSVPVDEVTGVVITIGPVALLDLLNPFSWWAHLRGARELEIAEERFHADRAAKLGARYESGKPPGVSQSFVSSTVTMKKTPTSGKSVRHVFLVYCAGPWYADDVAVWLAHGDDHEVTRTEEQLLGLLRLGDPPQKVEFVETEFPGGCVPRDGALMCRWTDGNDTHTEPLIDVTVRI